LDAQPISRVPDAPPGLEKYVQTWIPEEPFPSVDFMSRPASSATISYRSVTDLSPDKIVGFTAATENYAAGSAKSNYPMALDLTQMPPIGW
jgi:hypothetical protein